MDIHVQKLSSSIQLIRLAGEMDMYNYHELKERFLSLIEEHVRGYILDLDKLEYIDSSGVSTLIFLYTTVKKKNLKLWIVNVKGSVLKVLELTKLTEFLPIAGSLDHLLSQFKKKAKSKAPGHGK
jgi:anti-sigma B factor antagonist